MNSYPDISGKKTFSWRSILWKTDQPGLSSDIEKNSIPNYRPLQGDSKAGNDNISLTQKTSFRTLGALESGPIHSMPLPGRYIIKRGFAVIILGLLILFSVGPCPTTMFEINSSPNDHQA